MPCYLAVRKSENMAVLMSLFVLLLASMESACDFPDQDLHQDLFHDYDKGARPLITGDGRIDVEMDIYLLRIINFEKKVLTLDVWLFVSWMDTRLTWNPDKYDNISITTAHTSSLWVPDIVLYNSDGAFNDMNRAAYPVHVEYNGRVRHMPKEHLHVVCEDYKIHEETGQIDCTVVFLSWTLNSDVLRLSSRVDYIRTSHYTERNDWHFINSTVEAIPLKYDCCPVGFDSLRYTMAFKHKYNEC